MLPNRLTAGCLPGRRVSEAVPELSIAVASVPLFAHDAARDLGARHRVRCRVRVVVVDKNDREISSAKVTNNTYVVPGQRERKMTEPSWRSTVRVIAVNAREFGLKEITLSSV